RRTRLLGEPRRADPPVVGRARVVHRAPCRRHRLPEPRPLHASRSRRARDAFPGRCRRPAREISATPHARATALTGLIGRMTQSALSEGTRAGGVLAVWTIVLAVLGLAPAFSWIPEVPLLTVGAVVPAVVLG